MGSFNVTCSISKTTIDEGDEVGLIILKPKSYGDNVTQPSKIPTANFYMDANELYEPMFIPIFGLYNSYGSINKIEKNTHTDFLEKKIGLNIEDIISLSQENNKSFSSSSLISDIFDIKKFSFGDIIKEETLLLNGFTKIINNIFQVPFSNIRIQLLDKPIGFNLIFNNTSTKWKRKTTLLELQDILYKHHQHILGCKEEKHDFILEKLHFFKEMSFMFFNKNLYNLFLFQNTKEEKVIGNNLEERPSTFFLEKLGFTKVEMSKVDEMSNWLENDKFTYKKNDVELEIDTTTSTINVNGKTVHKINDFFNEVTHLKLDKTIINGLDLEFQKYVERFNSIPPLYDGEIEMRRNISRINRNSKISNLQRHITGRMDLKLISKQYIEDVVNGDHSFIEELYNFRNFCSSMNSTNSMFIPSYSGQQHGDNQMSKLLIEKSLMIVNDKISEEHYNIPSLYNQNKNTEECLELLNEVFDNYPENKWNIITGLSPYELMTAKLRPQELTKILETYYKPKA